MRFCYRFLNIEAGREAPLLIVMASRRARKSGGLSRAHPAAGTFEFNRIKLDQNMRILITGAAGFLGSHLADALLAEGNAIVGVDNLSTGSLENLKHLKNESRFEFREHDICTPFEWGQWTMCSTLRRRRARWITARLGIETLDGRIGRHDQCPEIAKKYNAKFLHASTSECYGDPDVHPQTEDYWGHVNPIGPRSVYDEAKRFSEALIMAYHRYHGVDTRLVRIFNTYGPRLQKNDGRVISNFMVQALKGEDLTVYGEGEQTRSFCYVSDEIEGILGLSRTG